jgi:diguanylate cyclase (GGDEF)-like protein
MDSIIGPNGAVESTLDSKPQCFAGMSAQIILLAEAHESPSRELVEALHAAGVNTLFEGLREEEILPTSYDTESEPSAEEQGPAPLAVLYELTVDASTETLQLVARHAAHVWPGAPLIACYHPTYKLASLGLRTFDHSLLKPYGFAATADSPPQLLLLLQRLDQAASRTDDHAGFRVLQELDGTAGNAEKAPDALDLPSRTSSAKLQAAFSLTSSLHFAMDMKAAADTILHGINKLVSADCWTIYLAVESSGGPVTFEVLASTDPEIAFVPKVEERLPRLPGLSSVPRRAGCETRAAREAFALLEPVRKTDQGRRVIAVPLTAGERSFGVLEGIRNLDRPTHFNNTEGELLSAMSIPLAAALANSVRIAEAERLSQTDDLTKLHSARFLRQFLVSEVKRARRYNSHIATLFLDLDDFKQINDSYGHLVGSHVLMEMASVLLSSVRDSDVVTRYGGDEFVVVLPETGMEQAAYVAERIRDRLIAHSFNGGRKLSLSVTASFGVAVFPEHAASAQQLMSAADVAMYEAKAANKNCVRFASLSLRVVRPEAPATPSNEAMG